MPSTADLGSLLASVERPSATVLAAARAALDAKTKPRGSLGRLETLAVQVSGARGTIEPGVLAPAVVLAAADHGIAAEGVSAYPQAVTWQMLANFAAGGAAICVLARQAGARLVVVDAGVCEPFPHPLVLDRRRGPGTANAARGPAMERDDACAAVLSGAELAADLAGDGVAIVALGEMGIGNSTTAACLAAALTGAAPAEVCGRGTGVDEAGLARKVAAVERALAVNAPDPSDPLGVLAALGGFEIAFLAGVALGAAAHRAVVVLDGFITGVAALVAARLEPALQPYLVASHRSAEPGHRVVLDALGLEPLLDLGLRLGEGSGAALALPLVAAAVAVLGEMATFASAGVSDSGA